ncbi:amino acid amidase [Mesorhizobium sp. M00.F.Ca.ET.186.01.1.1]|uniref:M55 family metallopeptidase n=1 Tax=Brevibacillus parabrevis TaxID=54914 RepID=UPI001135952D|nr:M55 family metallopeptidase [Brevibacillus parabrevis]TGV29163.1 amino acid amidase [Mesorhizobium sp. M00.F.Ca.ET.186.01.1.1]
MKLFISADLEGVAGIVNWTEANIESSFSKYFTEQMTKEVNAACEAAIAAGATDILVKDAHSTARNLDPSKLPEQVKILRGWTRDPYSMMAGLDESYDGVLFIGYHAAAGANGNPLAHTMNMQNEYVKINGEIASELLINVYIAASMGVPALLVTGDKMICEEAQTINPHIKTVPVNEGIGNAAISIHPNVALRQIKEQVQAVLADDLSKYKVQLPETFHVEIAFREHYLAYRGSFYPGAKQTGAKTVEFAADDYMEVLRFLFFVL